VVSFSSGIVGRYFYMQLLGERASLEDILSDLNRRFNALGKAKRLSNDLVRGMKQQALLFAGLTPKIADGSAGLAAALFSSVFGDLRMLISLPPAPRGIPWKVRRHLARYARARRRHATLGYFRKL